MSLLMMKPGTKVLIKGLIKAAQYNGKVAYITDAPAPDPGRVAVKLLDGKILAVKKENLEVVAPPTNSEIPSDTMSGAATDSLSSLPPPLFGLPPLKDEWGLTDLSNIRETALDMFKEVAAQAKTPEDAERAVFLAMHEGNVHKEAMAFPWLFPSGNCHFAQERPIPVRFEEYVGHLLRLCTGVFLKDEQWLDFAVTRIAILRYATGLPPMHKEEQEKKVKQGMKLDDGHIEMLMQFVKVFPEKSFCYRYLVGDEIFYDIAMLVMVDMAKEKGKIMEFFLKGL